MANKAKIYVYKEGNECANVSGGWTSSDDIWGNGKGTFIFNKNADHLYINLVGKNDAYMTVNCFPAALKLSKVPVSTLSWDYYAKHESASGIISILQVNGSEKQAFSSEIARDIYTYDINGIINSINYNLQNRYSYGYNIWAYIYSMYVETMDDVITKDSQALGSLSINLNSFDNILSFTSLSLIWNDQVLQTYEDITVTDTPVSYSFDDSMMFYGDNEVTIQVTYNQGDGLADEVADVTVTYNKDIALETIETPIPDLLANTSSREFLDRIYMINETVDMFINNLYLMLAYKGYEVDSNLRLSELI